MCILISLGGKNLKKFVCLLSTRQISDHHKIRHERNRDVQLPTSQVEKDSGMSKAANDRKVYSATSLLQNLPPSSMPISTFAISNLYWKQNNGK